MAGAGAINSPGNIAVQSNLTTGGPAGALNQQKDEKHSSTEAKFGDVLKNLQSQFGEKKEKPREIKKTLDKDDFLKIMITQMKHQDPTSPFKPEQMASEMAQFTSLEQLKNVNENLGKLAKSGQPAERIAMTGMIGKTLTVDRDRFSHTEGQNEVVSFKLPRDAKATKITLIHESGETVLEKEIGPQKQGDGSFQWDGLKANTLPAKSGNYILKVEARDEHDAPIPVSGQSQVRVIGVTFEGAEPAFLVGDAKHPSKVTMKSVVKIEENGGAAMPAAGAQAAAAGATPESAAAADAPTRNLIAFEKGKGSSNLDASALPPDAAAAIANFQKSMANPAQANAAIPANNAVKNAEKGFPNGLQDSGN